MKKTKRCLRQDTPCPGKGSQPFPFLFIVFFTFTLSLFTIHDSYAQGGLRIAGKVTDSIGKPLAGASISEKGTGNGTSSKQDGTYIINTSGTTATLVITAVGYQSKEFFMTSSSELNVVLNLANKELDEVVVIGYGTQRKSDLTGAVGSIGAEAITRSGAVSVEQALQGRVAGVQMTTNTGMPGGGTSIQIRGLNSINSTNEPIFVIDGVIIPSGTGDYNSNAFAFINPADVEKIDVLKDASATAIYGAQGANGVIIITTKKGKKGAAKFTADARFGVNMMPKFLDLMNFPEYAAHYNEFNVLRGNLINDLWLDPSLLGKGTDWQREIFGPAYMSNYDFSVSGASDATNYRISGNYLDQDGIAPGSGFKRYTFSAGLDSKVKSWFSLGGKLTTSYTDQKLTIADWNIINSAVRQSPSVPVRNLEGSYGGPEDPNDDLSNPLALAELIDRGNRRLNLLGNVYAELNPLKWITFRTEFSANMAEDMGRRFVPAYKLGGRENALIENQKTQRFSANWTWRNLVTFKHNPFEDHNVSLMLGQEITQRTSEYLSGLRYGGSNQLPDLDAGELQNAVPNGNSSRNAFSSWFGRLNYSYKNRYMLTSTLRFDGSSNFAQGNQWGVFPSAAFAWRISQEPFFKTSSTLTDLKLRIGYGKVGNSNVRAFAYAAMLANIPTIWGTGNYVANIPNPDLTWETTSSTNLGVDVSLFNGRIELTADVYEKKTEDLLLSLSLPAITGTSGVGSTAAPWGNVGSMQNRGIELSLNTKNIARKNFSWNSNFVFTKNKNKVLRLNTEAAVINTTYQYTGADIIVTRTEQGRSIGEFYGYKVIGRINSPGDLYDADGKMKIAIPEGQRIDQANGIGIGDLIWDDFNNDSVINELDRQYLGSPLPKFTYGVGNTFQYKNFDLYIFFQGAYGNKILNFLNMYIDNPNNTGNLTKHAGRDYVRVDLIDPSGSATDVANLQVVAGAGDMFRMTRTDANVNNRMSSRFVEDGSYLRLQNVSIGYFLPVKLISRMGLTSFKINASVQNAFTITKYTGYDPEVGMTKAQYSSSGQNALLNGLDPGRYPTPRNYSLTLSLGF